MNQENSIWKAFDKTLKKHSEAAKKVKPRWDKGSYVRVLKSLTENTHAIKEFLGAKCLVDSAQVRYGIMNEPRVEYILILGNRKEPFWEEELDYRFGKRK